MEGYLRENKVIRKALLFDAYPRVYLDIHIPDRPNVRIVDGI